MPASIRDPVNAALRTALVKNESSENSLDTQLAGSTKKALLSNIEFEPAGSYQSTVLDKLKTKYIVLSSADTPTSSKPESDSAVEESRKLPKYELFPLDAVQLGWNNCDWSVGAGMVNMGNTCYLNSTLQALFHVPALVNWLMSDKEHTAVCQDSGGLCIICAMRKTLQDSQQRNANSIRPLLIYNKLRLVCRNLIPGRQEDAHEFLRYLVEAMEKAYLSRFKNHSEFDSKIKETTPLNQILGGYLRSAVRCLECGHVSTTFQHFQDLLLDIRKAQTLDEALEVYFSREKLDDDSYHCEACQKKVPATKQFFLERTPMVLCIQLKRFSVTNNKITKHLSFRQRLDLGKYARQRSAGSSLVYRLAALVTHMGPTVGCGHYTAVAQSPAGNYYQFDDSMVRPISHQAVFNTNAYIMLYELEQSPYVRRPPPPPPLPSPALGKPKAAETPASRPVVVQSSKAVNGHHANAAAASSGVVGFTSDKAYGPELPPERNERQKAVDNGNVTSTNNNSDGASTSSSSSENDSDGGGGDPHASTDPAPSIATPTKDTDISSSTSRDSHSLGGAKQSPAHRDSLGGAKQSPANRDSVGGAKRTPAPSPNKSPATSVSSLSSPESTPKRASLSAVAKPLVPYEPDDGSSSEDSNHAGAGLGVEGAGEAARVSTKAAIGDWQVTSSTDIGHEPSSEGKSWTIRRPAPQQQQPINGASTQPRPQDTVVQELFKMSHGGYAAPVSTWHGSRSRLDKEMGEERRDERKRHAADSSDQGRAKHAKTTGGSNGYKSNPGYNPVQEYHNAKNWGHNNGGGYKSFYNGNKHRRLFHHKNYHKSYRYRQ
ncbi:unnamed protein product [Phaedon cochleariae]|uniref:Ubiquitin carboxyl-terminal hydrolase n=1 Tax=Phaedon cochleariae TaxID=80249 RepID=A0A9P0DR33_PHACE|nr:unnamed protein product [Phaedon cochleariae]